MAPRKRSVKKQSKQSRMVCKERKGRLTELKEKLRAIQGFPDIKVKDWMPVVMQHYRLGEKLQPSDSRYRTVHDFCKNWRTRLTKRQRSDANVAGPDHRMDEGV